MLRQLLRKALEYRISLIALGGISVFILIFYSQQTSKNFAEDAFDLLRKNKQDRIELIQIFSEKLLQQNKIEELRDILIEDSKKPVKGISGFCLKHKPTDSFASEGNPRFTPYFVCNQKCEKSSYHDYSDEFSGVDSCINGTTLSLFQFSPKDAFLNQYRLADSLSIAKDILLVSFIIFSILLLVKLELNQAHEELLSPSHGNKKRKRFSFLSDTGNLTKGLKKLNEELIQEKNRSESFSKELPGAIRKLYDQNQQTPIRFTGTLLRCDINHFSRFVQTNGEGVVFPLAKQFLLDVTKAAEFYHGYDLEFAGDEVILLFKDSPGFDSKKSAVFFFKEIEKLSNQYHEQTIEKYQFTFRVKVSVSYGDIKLDRDASGLFFSSEEFIRTVRLLKKVTVKDQNTFICSSYFGKELASMMNSKNLGSFQLDGYTVEHDLLEITEIISAKEIFKNRDKDQLLLFYARSPEDLKVTLLHLESMIHQLNDAEPSQLLKTLKELPYFSDSNSEITIMGERLLASAISHEQYEALPNLVSFILKIVPLNSSIIIQNKLLHCFTLDQPRLIADILSHFSLYKISIPENILTSLKNNPSNRVQANLIIYEMSLYDQMAPTTENTLKRLNALLKSKDPGMNASGAYAFGEVARKTLDRSLAAFEASPGFQSTYQQCIHLLGHTDQRVRNQSMLALIKIGKENDVKAFLRDN